MTLKALHTYLRLLENPAELKRRMPGSSSRKNIKEGLFELTRLADLESGAFKRPQQIADLIGAQRFVMIWGEPSLTERAARVFDSTKVLLTALTEPPRSDKPGPGQHGISLGGAVEQPALKSLPASWAQSKVEQPALHTQPPPEQESALESLKPLLSGNLELTCKLFRALFEHMLGVASTASLQQGSALIVNDLTGSKEHGRSFLSTALFILGADVDYENLVSFMIEQGLFGIPIFEHLLQSRDYCEAYFNYRKLERAFIGSTADEEIHLRNRLEKLHAHYQGKSDGNPLLEPNEQSKSRVDAYRAALDLLEAMALTPFSMSLHNAISAGSSNTVRSIKTVAAHFERFATGQDTKEQTNQAIADHLLAFARQFSADTKSA